MNKLLSIAFMIMTYSSLFSEPILNKKERILKNEKGEFFTCRSIDNENEECIELPIEEAKKLFHLFKENEELVRKVFKNIAITKTRNIYFNLLNHNNPKTVLKSTNNNLQEVSKEEIEELACYDVSIFIEAKILWDELIEKQQSPEYIRSILPEEEQKMFDALDKMYEEYYKKNNNN